MNLIDHIKKFLATKGLNWTGEIEFAKMDKIGTWADFRQAEIRDFEIEGQTQTIVIDFSKDGQIALVVVIDLINFEIKGIAPEYGLTCYAGDNDENVELCRERDLSQEWLEYMLVNGGLVYRSAIINLCAEKKILAETSFNNHQKIIDREIENLERKRTIARKEFEEKITSLSKLEEKAKNYTYKC